MTLADLVQRAQFLVNSGETDAKIAHDLRVEANSNPARARELIELAKIVDGKKEGRKWDNELSIIFSGQFDYENIAKKDLKYDDKFRLNNYAIARDNLLLNGNVTISCFGLGIEILPCPERVIDNEIFGINHCIYEKSEGGNFKGFEWRKLATGNHIRKRLGAGTLATYINEVPIEKFKDYVYIELEHALVDDNYLYLPVNSSETIKRELESHYTALVNDIGYNLFDNPERKTNSKKSI